MKLRKIIKQVGDYNFQWSLSLRETTFLFIVGGWNVSVILVDVEPPGNLD